MTEKLLLVDVFYLLYFFYLNSERIIRLDLKLHVLR